MSHLTPGLRKVSLTVIFSSLIATCVLFILPKVTHIPQASNTACRNGLSFLVRAEIGEAYFLLTVADYQQNANLSFWKVAKTKPRKSNTDHLVPKKIDSLVCNLTFPGDKQISKTSDFTIRPSSCECGT